MRQNRVDPLGRIIKTEARGTFMGNRGVIHDPNENIVRAFKHKAWITCALQFKERHRVVMTPNRWTELFFLDEATAFAAGHRPCCECRKENFKQFKVCWLMGNPQYGLEPAVSIKEIDTIIHRERIAKDAAKKMYQARAHDLPEGTFIELEGSPFLLANKRRYKWSPFGYRRGILIAKNETVNVLTPGSVVNAFMAGYRPGFEVS
jgi:hypothetical protein